MNEIDKMFAQELRELHEALTSLREVMDNDGVKYGLEIATRYIKDSPFWRDEE